MLSFSSFFNKNSESDWCERKVCHKVWLATFLEGEFLWLKGTCTRVILVLLLFESRLPKLHPSCCRSGSLLLIHSGENPYHCGFWWIAHCEKCIYFISFLYKICIIFVYLANIKVSNLYITLFVNLTFRLRPCSSSFVFIGTIYPWMTSTDKKIIHHFFHWWHFHPWITWFHPNTSPLQMEILF